MFLISEHNSHSITKVSAVASCSLNILFVISIIAVSRTVYADDNFIDHVVSNIKSNEAIYEEIDLRLRVKYLVDDPQRLVSSGFGTGFQASIRQDYTEWLVQQDDRFRFELDGENVFANGTVTMDRVKAFDGTSTRWLERNEVANVISGRQDEPTRTIPHAMLFGGLHGIPLSKIIANGDLTSSRRSETKFIGEEEVNGEQCLKLERRLYLHNKPEWYSRMDIWIMPTKNYMPVRVNGTTRHISAETPKSESMVIGWIEVEPGVYFPKRTKVTTYDPVELQATGKRVLNYTKEVITENVDLNPKYTAEFFSHVKLPDGIPVYEVEDDKILKSTRSGVSPVQAILPSGRPWWIWAVGATILVCSILFLSRFRSPS